MARRDRFPRKQRKSARDLRRRPPSREPYDVILIACEGEKTEPRYFEDLRNDFGLSMMNVGVSGSESDPLRLVERAMATAKQDGGYDRVFCVFDRDRHTTYLQAVDNIHRCRAKFKISAITSVPCFEFWLLLHYRRTEKPFESAHGGSICDEVIRELRIHLPGYDKAMPFIYERTSHLVDEAIRNARIVLENVEAAGTDNPSTRVHEMVMYLQALKQRVDAEG